MASLRRSSLPLLIGTVLVGVAAVFIATRKAPVPEAQAELLVPALRDSLDKVEEVRIVGAGNKRLVTLQRADAGFVVVERGGYRADTAALRALLLQLADARKLEAKTARKDRYAALGVEPVDQAKATGARVEIQGLASPISILVGRTAPQLGGGTFVREPAAAQSWLVSGSLVVEREPERWLEKRIADIAPARVQRVVASRDGKSFVLVRSDASSMKAPGGNSDASAPVAAEAAEDAPLVLEGSNPVDMAADGGAEAVAGALSELDLVDVMPASAGKPPRAGSVELVFMLRNGVAITSRAWQVDEKTRLQLSASPITQPDVDADAPVASGAGASVAAVSARKDEVRSDKAPAATDASAKASPASVKSSAVVADAFNQQWQGWTFVVPPHRTRGLMPERSALLRQAENP